MRASDDRSASGLRFGLYTSSLGNYFFQEIAELMGAGLAELGAEVRLYSERDGFVHDVDWHLVVAPHEFFQLGAGQSLKAWPANLILFNTEQPSTQWFALARKCFPKARCIWDIDFESALRIARLGYDCQYLPLGYAAASPMFASVPELPLHEGTQDLSAGVRSWDGDRVRLRERPLDVLFLGHSSPRREQFFGKHSAGFLRFNCHFHKSSVSRPLIAGQTTSMNTITSVGLAQRSKVLLNVHHGTDKYFEWHRIVLLGIAQRALVVSEPCSLAPPFRANVDYIEAPLDEVTSRLRYLLGTAEGQSEAQAMTERAYETLTVRCRLRDMLEPLVNRLIDPLADVAMAVGPVAIQRPEPARPSRQALSICVVTPDLTEENREREAGAAQVALAEALARAGHQVTLLHTQDIYGKERSPGYWLTRFAERGVRYIGLPEDPRVPLDAPEPLVRSYRAWEWLRRRAFDVVHFPDSLGSAYYSLLGQRQGLGLENTLLNVNAHGPSAWQRKGNEQFLDRASEAEIDFMERESLRLAPSVVIPTRYMLDWLRAEQWSMPETARVLPSLSPADDAPGTMRSMGCKVTHVVFVGPLSVEGGLDLFCDAVDRLPAEIQAGLTIRFFGNQGHIRGRRSVHYLRERSKEWRARCQVSRADDPSEMWQALRRPGTLAVIPALMHNSPTAVRQCLAFGIPFLASARGGVAELIAPADRSRALFAPKPKDLAELLIDRVRQGAAPCALAESAEACERQWMEWHDARVGAQASVWAANQNARLSDPGDERGPDRLKAEFGRGGGGEAATLPRVSVCLVHFNRPEYLREALASLEAQDYPNFEVVLVDDGSTKPEALDYLRSLERVFNERSWLLVRQENRYLGAARNTAARHAGGEYLLFMDDDNYAKPNELSTFVRVAQRTGADILTCAMDLFTGKRAPVPGQLPKTRWLFLGGATTAGVFRNVFGDANALIRRDVFERLGGFTEDYGVTHEDWEFHARAVLQGCRLEFVPEALFWYRYTPGSMIHHTSRFANHQRSLRPYLAQVPESLRELVQLTQGFKLKLDEFSGSTANYEFTRRLLKSLLAAGKLLAEMDRGEADAIFMEVLKCAEGLDNHGLHVDALLKTAKTLAELGRSQLALKLAERAAKLAELTGHEASLREAPALVEAIRNGRQDLAVACAGMSFLDEESETTFLRAPKALLGASEGGETPAGASRRGEAVARLKPRWRAGYLCAEPIEFACPYLRVHSVLERLRERGVLDLIPVGGPREGGFDLWENALAGLDLLVVQRQMAAVLPWSELRKRLKPRTKVVFEIDDALTALPEWHRARGAYELIRPRMEEYLRGADLVTVTTAELKRLYASFNANIAVLPNAIDERLWREPTAERTATDPVRILFSGTLDHERDLASVEDALVEVLDTYAGRVEFVYWGNVTERLRRHPRVKAGPEFAVDYRRYATTLQALKVSFAIVPLEDNPFNRAKSAIKWLEYSACGLSAIFSDSPAYRDHVVQERTGLLASTREEWVSGMKRLVDRADLRVEMGRAARQVVLKQHTVEATAGLWEAAYERLLADSGAASAPRVSIVIPTFNQLRFTRQCLAALGGTEARDASCEVIVVDNGSTDGTVEFLREAEQTGRARVVLNPTNLGFAKACNQGARTATGKYLIFLNNDTEPRVGWLDALIAVADQDGQVAAVGSKLLFPDGTLQHAGVVLAELPGRDPLLAVHAHYRAPADLPEANVRQDYPALTAACLLARKEHFHAVGGFDEGYYNGYEDVDLCLQLRQRGWRCVYEPASVVVHHESQSGPERFQRVQENIRRLHEKWLGKVEPDARCLPDGSLRMLHRDRSPTSPGATALTSIVILTHNQLADTRLCLESVAAHTPEPHEIIVIDNGSSDGTPEYLRGLAEQRREVNCIFNASNRGFAAGTNQGLARARGEQIVLLNNDTVVTPDWLGGLLAALQQHPTAGLAGPMTNYVSGPQLVEDVPYRDFKDLPGFAAGWAAAHEGQVQAVDRLVGFCLVVRRAVVEAIGGFDERYGSGNFEDDDYCLRASVAGFGALVARQVYIHHTGSQTFKGAKIDYRASMLTNWRRFKAKWGLPADAPIERGYRLPLRLTDLADLKVTLVDSDARSAAQPAMEIPAVARAGDLKRGYDLLSNHDLLGAWTATQEAINRRPFHPEGWLLLAEIAWNAGQQSLVKQCVARAERLAPKWQPARKFLKKHPARSAAVPVQLPALAETGAPRLTVCMIVRDEEDSLPRCLESICEVALQVVVVDTGSTDRSIEIARQFGAEVYTTEWTDDFSAARNLALEKATGDWVLVLDADEELPVASRQLLRDEMQRPEVLACRLPIVDEGREEEGASYVPRLFRNAPGLFFVGRIHEQVFSSLEVRRKEWALENRLGQATLLHHGYTEERIRDRGKVARNLRLLENAVREHPGEANLLMNLGLELVRSDRREEGLRRYWEAFRALSALAPEAAVPELRETLLTQMATHLSGAGDFAGVVRLLRSPLALAGGLTASLHFPLGLALMNLRRAEEAAEEFRECLAKRHEAALCPINTEIRKAGPRHCLALCLAQLKQTDRARETFEDALREDPPSRPLRVDYARFLAETGDPVAALKTLHELMGEDPADPAVWVAGGQLALAQPEFIEFALDWTGEAVKHHPDDSRVLALRGEAVLLSGRPEEALEFWKKVDPGPAQLAAELVCLTALGQAGHGPVSDEPRISQEFLRWYRRLIDYDRETIVVAINERLDLLQPVLPSVAAVLESALVQAG